MDKNVAIKVQSVFKDQFNEEPLVVFSPGRINLIGEHTDYNKGFVFPAAIDRGIFAALSTTKEPTSTVIALDENESYQFTLDELIPVKNGGWKNYILGIVAEIQKSGKKVENFNLVFSGDIPQGAGLSSSAALENAIAYGLNELFKLRFSKKELIYISQRAEHNFVGVQCGIMDQYASMFGQENSAILLDCRNLEAVIHTINFESYEIVLINSNIEHELAESAYNKRRAVCERVASILDVASVRDVTTELLNSIKDQLNSNDYEKVLYVIEENQRVLEAAMAIRASDYKSFGKLLYDSHSGLKNKYQVSCKELDFLVGLAKHDKNVLGARMMGGGFGGCTINLVKKSDKDFFINTVKNKYWSAFDIHPVVYQVKLGNGVRLVHL